jgi:hypothetical protein
VEGFYASRRFSVDSCSLRCRCPGHATGVATPAPKSSTIDIIKQPSLLRQKLAGNNCQTTCQWIGGRQFWNAHCFYLIVLSADPFGSQSSPLGNLGRAFVFIYGSGPIGWRVGRFCSLALQPVVRATSKTTPSVNTFTYTVRLRDHHSGLFTDENVKEANVNLRMKNPSSRSYDFRMVGAVALVAALLIVAVYALAVEFPIGPDKLATFAFPP